VAKFFEQLENHWEIYDGKGKKHNVEFNGSAIQPLFTTGWDTLRNYYSLTGDKHFFFFYYGGTKFFMLINTNSNYDKPCFFPTFHSMTTKVGTNRKFIMQIGEDDITATTLVSQ
jgi:hypothetical protein